MKRYYDIIYAVILVLFLVVAIVIDNAILKGISLLLFSGVLIFNTIVKLRMKKDDKFTQKLFYGILLFLESVLAVGAIYEIITALIDAR